jgi:O-glycosyl hydrolase
MKVNGKRGHGGSREEAYGLAPEELRLPFQERRADTKDPKRTLRLHENRLRPDRYLHFAKTLVEWTRLLDRRGVQLYGLSLQNEPRFSHWFESCVYTPAELARLHETVVEMFAREGQALPRLFTPETMSRDTEGNQAYLERIFQNRLVATKVHAIATHGYLDGYAQDTDSKSAEKVAQLADSYRRRAWLTEGGSGDHAWPAPLHSFASSLMDAFLIGQASLITPWQCVGSSPSVHDLAGVRERTKKSFVSAQFFRHLRPGMQRVHVEQPGDQSRCVAFADPGGRRYVVIGVNRGTNTSSLSFLINRRKAQVLGAYGTDSERNCGELAVGEDGRAPLPAESVVTWLLSS